jgi:hypothetical protein
VRIQLLQAVLNVLDRCLTMVPLFCNKVKIHEGLNPQQGVCEGNAVARLTV